MWGEMGDYTFRTVSGLEASMMYGACVSGIVGISPLLSCLYPNSSLNNANGFGRHDARWRSCGKFADRRKGKLLFFGIAGRKSYEAPH